MIALRHSRLKTRSEPTEPGIEDNRNLEQIFHYVSIHSNKLATSNPASENPVPIPSQPFSWEALQIRVKIEDNAVFKSLRSFSNKDLQ